MVGPPVLVAYDGEWPDLAEALLDRVRSALVPHGAVDAVDHIGSTAVPGLQAKPFLDLQVRLPRLPPPECLDPALAAIGFEVEPGARPDSPGVTRDIPRGSDQVPGDVWAKRLFVRPDGPVPAILHVRLTASPWGRNTVWFRDWLRAHPIDRDQYGAMKARAAETHAHDADFDDYTREKTAYFERVQDEFESWAVRDRAGGRQDADLGLSADLAHPAAEPGDDDLEQPLSGGNASGAVARVGDTVRKPWLPTTAAANRYVEALRSRGVDAPAPRGRDGVGRQILEYVPGRLAHDLMPLDSAALRRIGGMVRAIHDASAGLPIRESDARGMLLPVENADLMCHNELAPWNLIVGQRWVFIDWDGAGPSTRLWDLAYAAQAFGMLVAGQPVASAAERRCAFVDGYGADRVLREALPAAMARRTGAMSELLRSGRETGLQPWARMHDEGHVAFCREANFYVAKYEASWAAALTR